MSLNRRTPAPVARFPHQPNRTRSMRLFTEQRSPRPATRVRRSAFPRTSVQRRSPETRKFDPPCLFNPAAPAGDYRRSAAPDNAPVPHRRTPFRIHASPSWLTVDQSVPTSFAAASATPNGTYNRADDLQQRRGVASGWKKWKPTTRSLKRWDAGDRQRGWWRDGAKPARLLNPRRTPLLRPSPLHAFDHKARAGTASLSSEQTGHHRGL